MAPPPSQARPEGREAVLEIRRRFTAPRERVYAAWATKEKLEKWMCTDVPTHTVVQHVQDIRPGGRWRTEVRDPAKNAVYWGEGEYREVRPPEKIVFTWSWTKEAPGGGRIDMHPGSTVSEVTVEFFTDGTGTELVLTHRGLRSEQIRREHQQGWTGCLDELEKIL